ncbi:MAG TPA: M28 family peptidase [Nitrospirales bacterium]|nr:M28 family peptidase [Nitrospirales bacterium]
MYSTTPRRFLSTILLAAILLAQSVSPASAQSLDRAWSDIAALSGPGFHGRQAGTEDDTRSAAYVGERFSAIGLAVESQSAPLVASVIDPHPRIAIHGAVSHDLAVGRDYLPLLDSPSVSLTAPIVFVGYGISDPGAGFDEYAGQDVRGRVVLLLRGKPETYRPMVTHADKERIAREHGAAALVMITAPIVSGYDARRGLGPEPMAIYSQPPGITPLPGAWIRTSIAEQMLVETGFAGGRSLRDIQQALDRLQPQSGETGLRAELHWNTTASTGSLVNVSALLAGSDPALRDETVVIGAHRDHFGLQAGLLFAGADDNASGTAMLLEAARRLAAAPTPPRRSILFVSFSGEERGLLGSRLYVMQPRRPLARTVAMLNVDHAGIGNGRVTVGVTGLSQDRARNAAGSAGVETLVDLFGFFPGGDHVPFKEAGVPTIAVVSGGAHAHFHRPTDLPETLQRAQFETVLRYVTALLWELANN